MVKLNKQFSVGQYSI